jgi:protein-S-isoprenylcysteine O-methyltransferase Ste14
MMDNKVFRQIVEFVLTNVVWYGVFALIYFDLNPLNWWLFQNLAGRIIIILLQLSIYFRIKKQEEDLKNGKTDEE